MDELRQRDLELVGEQIGRQPTTPFKVTVRCAPDGHPLVIRNFPVDADGHPFPTLYWLTCPDAVRSIARLESQGEIARLNQRFEDDPAFAEAVTRSHESYARERTDLLGAAEGSSAGGVGGTRIGVKCLHAHYAYHLSGGTDPLGAIVAEQIEPIHAPPSERRVGVIDMGTNSIRLLIADPGADGLPSEIGRDLVITRLGRGVDQTGTIAPESLARTAEVLARYGSRMGAMHVARRRVCATSAVRDASNREELASMVSRLTGCDLEVISGETEAALSLLGATTGSGTAADPGSHPWLVVDIGGGSTEFILGDSSGPLPGAVISTQMGSVRLTERHLVQDPPTDAQRAALVADVGTVLDQVEARLSSAPAPRTLIGVAGTATTMQALALGLERDDPDAIHWTTLSLADAQMVLHRLAAMTDDERAGLSVMPRGRGDVIVAGAEILVAIMERWGLGNMVISEADILDGLAVELLAAE